MQIRFPLSFASLAAGVVILAAASKAAMADDFYNSSTAFANATTGMTTVGFPSPGYGGYSHLSSPYEVGAITYSWASPTGINLNDAAYYLVVDGLPANSNNYVSIFGDPPADTVMIAFPASTAFSIDLGGTVHPNEDVTVTLSDGYSFPYTANSFASDGVGGSAFLGFTSPTLLTSATVSLEDTAGYNQGTIDGVAYGTAGTPGPVPEPDSLLLLATGMLGIAIAARARLAA
ncbi:MAG: PEP-CTERM sorting domain-containing protein [Terracidiphilus sp.]